MKVQWQFGVLAAMIVLYCALYPQFRMWYIRNVEWQGAYAYNDMDEVAYAAYLKSLIDGKPRKNDPYTGRVDSPEHPQQESIFSIQFATPYSIAIPARALGLSASTGMWLSGAIAALIAALAIFWLLSRMTEDPYLAMAGALVVLCGGLLAAGEGALGDAMGWIISYPYTPGFRRYVPVVPLAVFFVLCGLVWKLLSVEEAWKRALLIPAAVFCFAFTVYSYFYIWTAAAAWLACLGLILIIARPEGWQKQLKLLGWMGFGCLLSLTPYAYLMSNRSPLNDEIQMVVLTRQPDLWRFPEILGYAVIGMLLIAVLFKLAKFREPVVLFTFSLALTPMIVLNHQVITGRSLQPIHYQMFIGNYVAALALMAAISIFFRPVKNWKPAVSHVAFVLLAVAAGAWGIYECRYPIGGLDWANVLRDDSQKVGRRLTQLSGEDVPAAGSSSAVALVTDGLVADELPTFAPQSVLWAHHQHVFSQLSWQESKERYYQYLYYNDFDEKWLENDMKKGNVISIIALFGWSRHTDRLTSIVNPASPAEFEEEARKYGEYIRNFDPRNSPHTVLSYVVVPRDNNINLTNLDKWYERDFGETVGYSILYRLKLRKQKE